MPSPVQIIYPEGLGTEGRAEFLTHKGERLHVLSIETGTEVYFFGESATTVYDLRIEEHPNNSVVRSGFSTELSSTVDLVAVDEGWKADFGALVDAKDIAITALAKRAGSVAKSTVDLLEEQRNDKKLKEQALRVLGAASLTVPIVWVASEKIEDIIVVGYAGAFCLGILSAIELARRTSNIKYNSRLISKNDKEEKYIQESIDELKALAEPLTQPVQA